MRRRRVIIHPGYHKTGTTSIQVALTNSRRRLRAAGTLYPQCGVPDEFPYGHHLLPWSLMKHPPAHSSLGATTRDGLWRNLREEIEACSAPLVILSSEEFDRLDRPEIESLARRLQGYDVVPVIFLRNHADLVESMFRTHVIHLGYSAPITCFAAEETPRLDFANMVRDWTAIAHDGATAILSYEDPAIRRDSVAAFMGALGIDPDVLGDDRSVHANISMPAFVCEIVRHLRAQRADGVRVERLIAGLHRIGFGAAANARFVCMPRALRAELDERFRTEAAALAADPAGESLRGTLTRWAPPVEPVVIAHASQALTELGYRFEGGARGDACAPQDVPFIGAVTELTASRARGWLDVLEETAAVDVVLRFGGTQLLWAAVDPATGTFALDLTSAAFRAAASRVLAPSDHRFELTVEAVGRERDGDPARVRLALRLPADVASDRSAAEWLDFLSPGPAGGGLG